jgi:hypothetical protein
MAARRAIELIFLDGMSTCRGSSKSKWSKCTHADGARRVVKLVVFDGHVRGHSQRNVEFCCTRGNASWVGNASLAGNLSLTEIRPWLGDTHCSKRNASVDICGGKPMCVQRVCNMRGKRILGGEYILGGNSLGAGTVRVRVRVCKIRCGYSTFITVVLIACPRLTGRPLCLLCLRKLHLQKQISVFQLLCGTGQKKGIMAWEEKRSVQQLFG